MVRQCQESEKEAKPVWPGALLLAVTLMTDGS